MTSIGREKDNPGFDAVIGNPPYVSPLPDIESDFRSRFLLNQFITATGRFDLYITSLNEKALEFDAKGWYVWLDPTD